MAQDPPEAEALAHFHFSGKFQEDAWYSEYSGVTRLEFALGYLGPPTIVTDIMFCTGGNQCTASRTLRDKSSTWSKH